MDSKKTVYPYIPNSAPDVQAEMMAEVGISDVMELYEEIPVSYTHLDVYKRQEYRRRQRHRGILHRVVHHPHKVCIRQVVNHHDQRAQDSGYCQLHHGLWNWCLFE